MAGPRVTIKCTDEGKLLIKLTPTLSSDEDNIGAFAAIAVQLVRGIAWRYGVPEESVWALVDQERKLPTVNIRDWPGSRT